MQRIEHGRTRRNTGTMGSAGRGGCIGKKKDVRARDSSFSDEWGVSSPLTVYKSRMKDILRVADADDCMKDVR